MPEESEASAAGDFHSNLCLGHKKDVNRCYTRRRKMVENEMIVKRARSTRTYHSQVTSDKQSKQSKLSKQSKQPATR